MKNDVWPGVGEDFFHQLKIADVTDSFFGEGSGHEGFVEIGRGVRRNGEAVDMRTKISEPEAEPGTLEAGVTGYECSFAAVKLTEHPLPSFPRRLASNPELLKLLLLTLGVHALPKSGMTVRLELAFA